MSMATKHVSFFRTHWTDRLVDACTIARLTARGAINSTTLVYDSPTNPQQYTGACLIRARPIAPIPTEFGQQSETRVEYDVYLPHTATGILPDDLITVTASVTDAEMMGKVLKVVSVSVDSYRVKTHIKAELNIGTGREV